MSAPVPTPSVVPYLLYNDPARIRDFLVSAFAFTEVTTQYDEEGRAGHVELRRGDKFVMLSRAQTEMGMASPAELPAVHAGVLVYVEDVDAHFRQASEAGAHIWYEPQDMPYGQREYGARDPENGFWCFATLL